MQDRLRADEYDYAYPESLVAIQPSENFRILLGGETPKEINKSELFGLFNAGDVLVINDTRVERRRILTSNGLEILFCEPLEEEKLAWRVLFMARELNLGDSIELPGEVRAELVSKGLPQTLRLNRPLNAAYFEQYGDLALPPYIQKARGERRSRKEDEKWYQTEWAKHSGSQASPTASLHFKRDDLLLLQNMGVTVAALTLHVGVGTFLPIKSEFLHEHKMHSEYVHIPQTTIDSVTVAKRQHRRVWALGTTVVRSLESWATGRIGAPTGETGVDNADGVFGNTDLFISPGYRFEVVDAMMTNFHQPRTTLLALVAAFAGQENLRRSYQYAIENQFRLFSYGDLSAWIRN